MGTVKRVLLLIPTLDRSGAEKQFTLLATRLPRDRFQVEAVALTRGGPYADDLRAAGIPLTVIGKRGRFDPFALRHLRKLIRQRQPDILHTWLFAANAYGRLAAGGHPACRVVVSERCVDSWKAGWQLWLDRRLIPRTTHLVGNSQAVADFYHNLGYPAQHLSVIPNAVLPAPTSASRTRDSVCQEFGIPPAAKMIGCVGRLAPQKRVSDLIWAFELLSNMNHDVYLLIVGDGPQRAALEQFARAVRIIDRIRFTGHRPDVAALLPHMDVFWLASDFEGQSNSLLEAMSAGRPVVVSDIPPNREVVAHERTGLVVPVGDRVAFTKATDRLFHNPDLATALGASAREHVQSGYSLDRMIAAHVHLYEQLADVPA